jgi:hypothetical protein
MKPEAHFYSKVRPAFQQRGLEIDRLENAISSGMFDCYVTWPDGLDGWVELKSYPTDRKPVLRESQRIWAIRKLRHKQRLAVLCSTPGKVTLYPVNPDGLIPDEPLVWGEVRHSPWPQITHILSVYFRSQTS